MPPLTNAETNAAKSLIALALAEDLGDRGDLTSAAIIPEAAIGEADFIARAPGVLAGLPVVELVLAVVDPRLKFTAKVTDGAVVTKGEVLGIVSGLMRSLLAAERTALNFLQQISGVATLTKQYVDATNGKSQVLDTRKTTPGWRLLEKYAVRCGGGHNHRMGLDEAILIKDNHLAALGGGPAAVAASIQAARAHAPGLSVEIEVDSMEQFETALTCQPEIILLDNMNATTMTACVVRRNAVAPAIQLEASGGITLETITTIAATGVDRISIGAITHSAPALDIALDYRNR